MKTLNKIILPLAVAGSLFLGGNSFSQINKQKQTPLEKYNQENKQVYEDFIKFCNENPNKKKYAESSYEIEFPNSNYSIYIVANKDLYIKTGNIDFWDPDGNGLDKKSSDSYVFANKNTGLIEIKNIKNLSSKKQLSVAKEYTTLLKKIMREEKY